MFSRRDMATGESILRDYINATIGFQALGGLIDKSPRSVMRMLGPHEHEGLHLKVQAVR